MGGVVAGRWMGKAAEMEDRVVLESRTWGGVQKEREKGGGGSGGECAINAGWVPGTGLRSGRVS